MAFKPISDRFLRKLERSLDLPIPTSTSPGAPTRSASSPTASPPGRFLSETPSTPLTWLWPGRIPRGHLTLLDATPGSGLSLLALTLAACVSSGSPLPDGTPTEQGNVILLAPYDGAADTLKPRLESAGGNPSHVLLFRPLLEDASRTTTRTRSSDLPNYLSQLAATMRQLDARLLIIDPASAIPGLSRCLPTLIELAQQTNCAILLTRSLRQPPADPLHAPGPTSPLLEAARSRLLLAPDPADERQHLLLTTRHPLCAQPPILTYTILASTADVPIIHWLGERNRSHLERLCTGPLRSPQRQAILRFLQHSTSPHSTPDILEAACYDHTAGRKMLFRMKLAGELVSTARGLYTTPNHPCLSQSTDNIPPVPIVPTVPDIPPIPTVPIVPNLPSPPIQNIPIISDISSPPVPIVPNLPSPPIQNIPIISDISSPPVPIVPTVPDIPSPPVSNIPTVPDIPPPPVQNIPIISDIPSVPIVSTVPNIPPPPVPIVPNISSPPIQNISIVPDISSPPVSNIPTVPNIPSPPVPIVPTVPKIPSPPVSIVPNISSPQTPTIPNSFQCDLPPLQAVPITSHIASMIPTNPPVPIVPNTV